MLAGADVDCFYKAEKTKPVFKSEREADHIASCISSTSACIRESPAIYTTSNQQAKTPRTTRISQPYCASSNEYQARDDFLHPMHPVAQSLTRFRNCFYHFYRWAFRLIDAEEPISFALDQFNSKSAQPTKESGATGQGIVAWWSSLQSVGFGVKGSAFVCCLSV